MFYRSVKAYFLSYRNLDFDFHLLAPELTFFVNGISISQIKNTVF